MEPSLVTDSSEASKDGREASDGRSDVGAETMCNAPAERRAYTRRWLPRGVQSAGRAPA